MTDEQLTKAMEIKKEIEHVESLKSKLTRLRESAEDGSEITLSTDYSIGKAVSIPSEIEKEIIDLIENHYAKKIFDLNNRFIEL